MGSINLQLVLDQLIDSSSRLAFLTPFLVFASVGLLVAILIATRRRVDAPAIKWLIICSSANAVLSVLLLVPAFLAPSLKPALSNHSEHLPVTVMTANLWNDPGAIPHFISHVRHKDPDILFVQEAYEPWRTTLAEQLPDYSYVAGCRHPHTCNSAILSKLPLRETLEDDGDGHVAAIVQLETGMDGHRVDILIIGVHLSRGRSSAASRQLAQIANRAEAFEGDILIAGDFNLTLWDSRLQRFVHRLGLHRATGFESTWPSPSYIEQRLGVPLALPGVGIDHVFTSSNWRLDGHSARHDSGSDHYALTMKLQLITGPFEADSLQ